MYKGRTAAVSGPTFSLGLSSARVSSPSLSRFYTPAQPLLSTLIMRFSSAFAIAASLIGFVAAMPAELSNVTEIAARASCSTPVSSTLIHSGSIFTDSDVFSWALALALKLHLAPAPASTSLATAPARQTSSAASNTRARRARAAVSVSTPVTAAPAVRLSLAHAPVRPP